MNSPIAGIESQGVLDEAIMSLLEEVIKQYRFGQTEVANILFRKVLESQKLSPLLQKIIGELQAALGG